VSRVRSGWGAQGYVKRPLYFSPFSEPNDKYRMKRGVGDDNVKGGEEEEEEGE
jgi:hypothetical protein